MGHKICPRCSQARLIRYAWSYEAQAFVPIRAYCMHCDWVEDAPGTDD